MLSSTARNGQTSYRIRYRPSLSHSSRPLSINGYGIELALKRTDYIVIDDRTANAEDTEGQAPSIGADLEVGRSEAEVLLLDEDVVDLKPLSSKELLGLGLKTASIIMASDEPFKTLMKISENFPKHSSALTKRNASLNFIEEHSNNREAFLPAGYNVVWMNGMQVQSRQMDAFALHEQIRRERSIVENLRELGFSGLEAVRIMSHTAVAEAKMESESQRYDYRDTLEGGKVIIWLNDIEKDKRYSSWPSHTSTVG